jgi:hypothetical protein
MWRSDLLGFHGDTLGWINTKLTQQILTANNPIPGKNIKRPSETMLDVEDENTYSRPWNGVFKFWGEELVLESLNATSAT